MRPTTITNNLRGLPRRKTLLVSRRHGMTWMASLAAFGIAWSAVEAVSHALALETDLLTAEPPTTGATPPSPNPQAVAAGPVWRKTKATFYGHPYDDGKRRVCADGKTVYRSDGLFCATRLVPLGSIIEVRRGKIVLRLRVADTQAKRYGHLIDLPTLTWDKLGARRSVGMVPVEWRRVR